MRKMNLILSGMISSKKNTGITKFPVSAIIFFLIFCSNAALAQTTYTWNQTGTASWATDINWSPARTTPAANDILVFNNGAVTTVTNLPSQTIGQLFVSGNTTVNFQTAVAGAITIAGLAGGDDFTVATGSALNINSSVIDSIKLATGATGIITGNMNFSTNAHKLYSPDASGIIFNRPAVFTQDLLCTGNVFTVSTGGTNAVVFNSGSTFSQFAGSNPFALSAPSSKVVFNTGSLFKINTGAGTPSFSGRTYANVEYNSTAVLSSTGGSAVSIDTLTVSSGTFNINMTGTSGHSIKGDINVASGATLTFTPASAGTLNLNGSIVQAITNNGTLTFGPNLSLVVNNANGINVNSDISLQNLVTFTSGIVKLANTKVLSLGAAASVAGASNLSFVDGLVKKTGITNFKFPVGKTTIGYVPVEVTAITGGDATTAFSAEYVRSSATALGAVTAPGLDHVSAVDYWAFNQSGTAPTSSNVTGYWTNESSSAGSPSYISSLPDLVLANFNGSNWNSFGGVAAATGTTTAGSIMWTGATAFGNFSLGSTAAIVVPVNFNYLNGTKQNTSNSLNWKVTCLNSQQLLMNIERSSNGKNFTGIHSIVADEIRCLQPFNYVDLTPLSGLNYYRVKITDIDGKVTYSSIVALLNKTAGVEMLMLMPTPVRSSAVLNVASAQKNKLDIVITDASGKQIKRMTYTLVAGSNLIPVNTENLNAGTYQITGYSSGAVLQTIRFLKQ